MEGKKPERKTSDVCLAFLILHFSSCILHSSFFISSPGQLHLEHAARPLLGIVYADAAVMAPYERANNVEPQSGAGFFAFQFQAQPDKTAENLATQMTRIPRPLSAIRTNTWPSSDGFKLTSTRGVAPAYFTAFSIRLRKIMSRSNRRPTTMLGCKSKRTISTGTR